MATDLHTAANRLLKAWDLNDLIHEHIEALRQALANKALDKMAENARELGLDYEPAGGTQVSKVWWDGEKLMAKPISLDQFYKEPAQQEPVAHAVIAGALFDFMGWLTSRKERIVLSSADNASPAVEAITEFAKMRGLSLNDAKVQDWNTSPPAQRKPLTDEQMWSLWNSQGDDAMEQTAAIAFARAIEAAHGIKGEA